ncbi:MAG: MazG family protein [Ruminococcaceae bacterium]|nr:MazG family protein [Oscillospiraceae bacterium]
MNERAKRLTEKTSYTMNDLREIMELLRAEDGCPWDREQTHQSIRRDLIEETYEVVEGIDKDDAAILREELGDLMLQVVFHARIAEEAGRFDLDDVADGICRKLILRHPHIFGNVVAETADEVLKNWDAIKKVEKNQKNPKEVLDAVSHALPALIRADKICGKAKKLGTAPIAPAKIDPDTVGETLLAIVAAAKEAGVDCEKALSDTLDAYISAVPEE